MLNLDVCSTATWIKYENTVLPWCLWRYFIEGNISFILHLPIIINAWLTSIWNSQGLWENEIILIRVVIKYTNQKYICWIKAYSHRWHLRLIWSTFLWKWRSFDSVPAGDWDRLRERELSTCKQQNVTHNWSLRQNGCSFSPQIAY